MRWYEGARRDLPWRRTRDPYRIWISEIMLQQTRVAAVVPYYEKFLREFPNAAALARADQDRVLALWSGLGYYSRARNLHSAARQIAAGGEFPREYESIRALPGVGDYTAAAISSIAFGSPHTAIDGNVRRVVARLAGQDEIGDLPHQLLDRRDPGRWNQAMMELGATLCLPRKTSRPDIRRTWARAAGSSNCPRDARNPHRCDCRGLCYSRGVAKKFCSRREPA